MSSVSGVSSVPLFDASSAQNRVLARANAAVPGSGSGSTSGNTSTDSALTSSVGTTFMNLLVKELQNQDPTAPMDSTAMVGQMISLNQLDQLMSINKSLSSTTGISSSSTESSSTGSAGTMAARAALASPDSSSPVAPSSLSSNPTSILDLSGLPITKTNGVN